MALTRRLRYEVLRRDNHACRYCGATAPGVKLTVDHVVPVSLGGAHEPSNLVAACVDCNAGKSSSSPDQPLVDDVSADALRWCRAMAEASELMLEHHVRRDEIRRQFSDAWNDWKYGSYLDTEGSCLPLPSGWETSIDNFIAAGLPMEILIECINKAMAAKHVKVDSTFRYMCGIAWRKVTDLQEIAVSLLEADEED